MSVWGGEGLLEWVVDGQVEGAEETHLAVKEESVV